MIMHILIYIDKIFKAIKEQYIKTCKDEFDIM